MSETISISSTSVGTVTGNAILPLQASPVAGVGQGALFLELVIAVPKCFTVEFSLLDYGATGSSRLPEE